VKGKGQGEESILLCFICDEKIIFLQDDRFSFGHDKHFVLNAVNAGGLAQTLKRFFERFVTQTEATVMHRDERLRFEFVERAHRFFRIHVHFARERRIISTDREKRDLDVVPLADFLKSFEVSSVAAVKNGSTIGSNDKAAKAAMCIGKEARAPMMSRRERNSERPELDRLPFTKFVHDVEPEPVDQTSDANGNDDRLIGRNEPQGAAIEMIEVRVSHEHEVDRRQMMNVKAGLL